LNRPESFGPVARHYDVLMSHVPYDMWVGYYQLLLAQLDARPRRLLDVCCGTGLVAEILAGEGYEVTGFDISPHMIAEAQRKAKAQDSGIVYHVADAADLDLDDSFEGAYSFFDSLNYITEPERLRSAIARVARHLEPGGSFVFDVNTAYAFEKQMFDQREKNPKAPIQYEWTGEYDPGTRLIRVQMDFERNGQKFEEVHHQRAYEIEELTEYLREAGFGEIQIYDSYTLIPPRKKSDRLHFATVLA
jgi:SAM-dependent methyltransferase